MFSPLHLPTLTTLRVASLIAFLSLGFPAAALSIPMNGWAPVNGDPNLWTDASGGCLVKEERHGQAFPTFTNPDDAQAFAMRLQPILGKQVGKVVTQAVDRAGAWGVLATYEFQDGGVTYRVNQLYLSDRGLLRTITGSVAVHEVNPCANDMQDFIRFLAN